MKQITLGLANNRWVVSGRGFQATWSDLAVAAWSALEFAKLMRSGKPILGDGVPADALAHGARLQEILGEYPDC